MLREKVLQSGVKTIIVKLKVERARLLKLFSVSHLIDDLSNHTAAECKTKIKELTALPRHLRRPSLPKWLKYPNVNSYEWVLIINIIYFAP